MPQNSQAERSWRMYKNIRWALLFSIAGAALYMSVIRITVADLDILRVLISGLVIASIVAGLLERRARFRLPKFQK